MNEFEENEPESGVSRMTSDLRSWSLNGFRAIADLVLPPICVHCHTPVTDHGVLCADCWSGVEFITPPVCDRLGVPLRIADLEDGVPLSAAAQRDPPVFARARADAQFSGVMRNLIHGLKYADRHEASGMLARLMWSAGSDLLRDADLIMPVPLLPRKLWSRRFNQAAILARNISALSGVPADLFSLKRRRHTQSQVGLTAEDRQANMMAAFAVAPRRAAALAGKRILLIDDVLTTGSTLSACALVLKRAGASDVDCLAAATSTYQPANSQSIPHLGTVS
jgi:ComF family protein